MLCLFFARLSFFYFNVEHPRSYRWNCTTKYPLQYENQKMEAYSIHLVSFKWICSFLNIHTCPAKSHISILNGRVSLILFHSDWIKITMTPRSQDPSSFPPDPWTYMGPVGHYKFSNYHNPSVKLTRLATFLLTCIGDKMDATAKQGFSPHQPYPGGIFKCHLRYLFPYDPSITLALELKKVDAPNWFMTFSDLAEDLEALWLAALWFENRPAGFPELDFDVYRFQPKETTGNRGAAFLASHGIFQFSLSDALNVSIV